MFPKLSFCCPDLQASVAALERSLEEERERCRAESQRRKELHNALVVRTDLKCQKKIDTTVASDILTFIAILCVAPGVEREHPSSLQGATTSTL